MFLITYRKPKTPATSCQRKKETWVSLGGGPPRGGGAAATVVCSRTSLIYSIVSILQYTWKLAMLLSKA